MSSATRRAEACAELVRDDLQSERSSLQGGPRIVRDSGTGSWLIDSVPVRPQPCADPLLVAAVLAPLPLDLAIDGLARLDELPLPAKLVLGEDGRAAMVVEVPREGGRPDPERWVLELLDAALAWLSGDAGRGDVEALQEYASGEHRIEEVIGGLGWRCESAGQGTLSIESEVDGIGCRLRIQPLAGGAIRILRPATSIRAAGSLGALAMALFALEANRRLRLARLTLAIGGRDVVRVGWDTVLPPETRSERHLVEAVESLALAHGVTNRALRALGTRVVAEAYIATRRAP